MPQLPVSTSSFVTGPAKRKRDLEGSPKRTSAHLACSPRKRQHVTLKINIPAPSDFSGDLLDDADHASSPISILSDPDSLFDEPIALTLKSSGHSSSPSSPRLTPALLTGPPIQGLFFTPTLRLSEETENTVIGYCLDTYFHTPGVNQVMLFGRFLGSCSRPSSPSGEAPTSTGLPPILRQLLVVLETILRPVLPPETQALLFPEVPTRARQAILNLYQPGEGISPHVDLLRRFGDGIIGVSLGSGSVMQFAQVGAAKAGPSPEGERVNWDLYLPRRSVIVLSEDARYGWTHGIGEHTRDYVALPDAGVGDIAGRWIERGVRLSITFRWLLPGADIVGEEASSS